MTKEEKQEPSQTLDSKAEAGSASFVDAVNKMLLKASGS